MQHPAKSLASFREFRSLIKNLRYSNDPSQTAAALQEVAYAVQSASKSDLEELLILLNSSSDYELKVKLLSILSAYLISDNRNADVILTCRSLYDTVNTLLGTGLPIKTKTVLNFILALLSTEADGSSSDCLSTFARNMLRVSGSLSTMCEIFAGAMIYQDTWIALCQSIAEACSGCELNQNYCSHVIPLCIRRCCLGNPEVCIILQSLLYNHRRNVELFFKSRGETIFTRETLQYDKCLQVLNNIVKISEHAVEFVCSSGLVQHLHDLLQLYGPNSQVGMWATIILHHLDTHNMKDNTCKNGALVNLANQQPTDKPTNLENLNENDLRNIGNRIGAFVPKMGNMINTRLRDNEAKPTNVNNIALDHDDTTHLFQNVINEVLYWNSKGEFNRKETFAPKMEKKTIYQNVIRQFSWKFNCGLNAQKNTGKINRKAVRQESMVAKQETQAEKIIDFENNYSFADFAFGKSEESPVSIYSNSYSKSIRQNIYTQHTNSTNALTKNSSSKGPIKDLFQCSKTEEPSEFTMKKFRPTFASTPKRQHTESSITSRNTRKLSKMLLSDRKRRVDKRRARKMDQMAKSKNKTVNFTSDVKQTSMTTRLFSAINESCTTLVKSVKSIFSLKKDNSKTNADKHNGDDKKENDTCSYSFTNYMRKRDAVLAKEKNPIGHEDDEDSNSLYRTSCRTCKDTFVLQQKMNTDEHLQQTIKRLKIGVNLYGCDFKKISRVMWPRDKYMSPTTLYNLYRKLIMNSSQHKSKLQQH